MRIASVHAARVHFPIEAAWPRHPGLGITVREDVARAYTVAA